MVSTGGNATDVFTGIREFDVRAYSNVPGPFVARGTNWGCVKIESCLRRRFTGCPDGPIKLGGEADPLYDQAVEIVLRTRRPSISLVQRHLRIGYNRAARLIEQMEQAGLVSTMQSNGNREVLVPAKAE